MFTDETPMPFGKHKGKNLEDVPSEYLSYLWNQMYDDYVDKKLKGNRLKLMDYIKDNSDSIET